MKIPYFLAFLLIPSLCFAGARLTLEDGTGYEIGTSARPLYISTGGNSVGGTVNSGVAGYLPYYASTGNQLSQQSALFVSGSNVGIGTTVPQYPLDVNGLAHFGGSGGVTVDTGGAFRTDTTSGHTALLQAYNTGTVAYTTFGTLTAGATPTFDLGSTTTIGGVDIVSRTGTQTLTNKTLTTPTITSITNSGTITIPTGTDTLVNLAGTQTLSSKTLTSPKVGTSILDTSGNKYFSLTPAGSAVEYLDYTNGATGADPTFTVSGTDANRGLTFTMAGTGGVTITSSNSTNPSTITHGLTINNGATNNAADDFIAKTTSDANAIHAVAATDNVGIGTSIPSTKLDIIGKVRATTGFQYNANVGIGTTGATCNCTRFEGGICTAGTCS